VRHSAVRVFLAHPLNIKDILFWSLQRRSHGSPMRLLIARDRRIKRQSPASGRRGQGEKATSCVLVNSVFCLSSLSFLTPISLQDATEPLVPLPPEKEQRIGILRTLGVRAEV
jgi:hypothetical protein